MSMTRLLRAEAGRRIGGLYLADVVAAVLLSAWAVALAAGVEPTGYRHGGAAASAAVLAMTMPAAWQRRAPLAAAATLGAGATLNGLAFGSMVRCGPALPAVFLVAFALGSRSAGARAWAGLLLCAGDVVTQAFYDPRLGPSTTVLFLPLLAGFFAIGRLARSRGAAADALRQRSLELNAQREETARLAIIADREIMTRDLESGLQERLDGIAAAAQAGQDALTADPDLAARALTSIEQEGRETLQRMRDMVGTLRDEAPREPQPTLAELPRLLARVTSADTRLHVDGAARALPAGLELASYRVIEHLLTALEDTPGAAVDVRLRFSADTLELQVSGPRAPNADLRAVLASARERVALHGGSIEDKQGEPVCRLVARLPLVSGST
jgi:signal transduction histidine kinase